MQRSLGLVKIIVNPHQAFVSATVTSVGYNATPFGYSLGYDNQSLFITDMRCRAIVVVRSPAQAEDIRRFLNEIPSYCVADEANRRGLK